MYPEDELIMLSGIQHIAFCERQYALIYIEQQWVENLLTIEGHFLHERVDDPFESEIRNDRVILRSLPVVSFKLGLYGRADIIELIKTEKFEEGTVIKIKERDGWWTPYPVEYKRGKPKPDDRDEVQLCAQAMCLEEMYNIFINVGYIFYGETRHRQEVKLTSELRKSVEIYATRMHELFKEGKTPPPVLKKGCRSCSMVDLCMPDPLSRAQSVSDYLKQLC
ncbi:MAG: CRISPR-associated protein Cas4 [Bacteroidales bacterium]